MQDLFLLEDDTHFKLKDARLPKRKTKILITLRHCIMNHCSQLTLEKGAPVVWLSQTLLPPPVYTQPFP